jgi:hypothetical protein
MKYLLLFLLVIASAKLFSQNLQIHYDFRHTIDPAHNSQTFQPFTLNISSPKMTLHHL